MHFRSLGKFQNAGEANEIIILSFLKPISVRDYRRSITTSDTRAAAKRYVITPTAPSDSSDAVPDALSRRQSSGGFLPGKARMILQVCSRPPGVLLEPGEGSLYYYSFYHTYQGTVLAVRYRYR